MAGLRSAFAGLRAADAVIRSRDRPGGMLMGLSAYLVGFAVIRTAANSYIYFSSLRMLVPREDAYALAVIGAAIACAPLSAGLVLSRGRPGGDRRLSLLPTGKAARLAIAALGPAIAALPAILLASALPAIAAMPVATWSLADYLKTATWFPATAAAMSLGVRSLAGAAASIAGRGKTIRRGHGRTVALAGALLVFAAANPAPGTEGGRAILSIFGTKHPAGPAGAMLAALPIPTGNGHLALAALAAALAFAVLAAVAEDASLRRSRAAGSGGRPRYRRSSLAAVWPMAAVVDRKHDSAWSLAACLALALAANAQGASPSIPLAAAAAALIIRAGSALAFIATESVTTRRFALIQARPGTVDRAYLGAALALAAVIASPLAAAAVALALRGPG